MIRHRGRPPWELIEIAELSLSSHGCLRMHCIIIMPDAASFIDHPRQSTFHSARDNLHKLADKAMIRLPHASSIGHMFGIFDLGHIFTCAYGVSLSKLR
jgi:hypothetical protein